MNPYEPQQPQNDQAPEQPVEPTPQPEQPVFPRPTDAWPPRQEAMGDVEPSTQSNDAPQAFEPQMQATARPTTDELIAAHNQSTQTVAPGLQPRRRRRAPLVIALLSCLLVVLVGSGVAAYMWYQDPNKVVVDGLLNAMTAKTVSYTGTIDAATDSVKISTTIDGASNANAKSMHAKAKISMGAVDVNLEASGMYDKDGNVYFKLMNAKDLETAIISQPGLSELKPTLDPIVSKVDNQWIKVAADDKAQQCLPTTLNELQTNVSARNELATLYGKHQFIVVKQGLGTKNGSVGYKLAIDATKENAFVNGLAQTRSYSDLKKCNSAFSLDDYKINPADVSMLPQIDLWVSQWGHQVTSMTLSNPSSEKSNTYNITIKPTFNGAVSLSAPTNTIDANTLSQDIAPLLMNASGATGTDVQDNAATSMNQANATSLEKRIEAYNADSSAGNGNYPTYAQILAATGISQVPSDVKAVMVNHTAQSGTQIGLVPCANATKGGTISYIDEASGAVSSIHYGSC